jgi:hypothetical protein
MLNHNKPHSFKQQSHNSLLDEILNLIAHKTNYQPRLGGKGYILRCPAHDDRKASLSVAEGHDGRVLLKCFCGCHIEAICNAIGIKVKDLFPKKTGR